MAQQQNYGVNPNTGNDNGSKSFPERERLRNRIKTVTKVEKVTVPVVARPKPVQLTDTRVFVVTKDNYDEFVKEFTELYGDLAFVALSMRDYENLALNIADLKRFLEQQNEIIVYYEKALSEDTKTPSK